MNNIIVRVVLFDVFLAVSIFSSYAQKLPNKQQVSMRAPSNIKIDGKTNEWNDTFMAFNDQIALFYTIANDDDNIYLVIHSTNSLINRKIMRGGITFTINTLNKKEKGGVSITYPVINSNELNMMKQNRPTGLNQSLNEKADKSVEAAYLKRRDSLTLLMDKKNLDKLKDIRVTGIKEIEDPIISIYNQEGIKAAALAGSGNIYNYELAIPIKYIGKLADNQTFYYNIKLLVPPMNGGPGPPIIQGGGSYLVEGGIDIRSLDSVTDFWGEYTLAKKP